MEIAAHEALGPSSWVCRWSHLIGPGARLLDVACGRGRHVRWAAERGCKVTAVDRDAEALAPLRAVAEVLVADLENAPWPFARTRFDAVLCTNYLWRPLLPALVDSVDEGGVLLYETFGIGQAAIGRPSNPEFLLQPGELLRAARDLRVVGYEEGFLTGPDRCVQRIAAVRDRMAGASGGRWALPAA